MSIGGGMHCRCGIYMLQNVFKKKKILLTFSKMNKPGGYYTKENVLITKSQILCDSTYREYLK